MKLRLRVLSYNVVCLFVSILQYNDIILTAKRTGLKCIVTFVGDCTRTQLANSQFSQWSIVKFLAVSSGEISLC